MPETQPEFQHLPENFHDETLSHRRAKIDAHDKQLLCDAYSIDDVELSLLTDDQQSVLREFLSFPDLREKLFNFQDDNKKSASIRNISYFLELPDGVSPEYCCIFQGLPRNESYLESNKDHKTVFSILREPEFQSEFLRCAREKKDFLKQEYLKHFSLLRIASLPASLRSLLNSHAFFVRQMISDRLISERRLFFLPDAIKKYLFLESKNIIELQLEKRALYQIGSLDPELLPHIEEYAIDLRKLISKNLISHDGFVSLPKEVKKWLLLQAKRIGKLWIAGVNLGELFQGASLDQLDLWLGYTERGVDLKPTDIKGKNIDQMKKALLGRLSAFPKPNKSIISGEDFLCLPHEKRLEILFFYAPLFEDMPQHWRESVYKGDQHHFVEWVKKYQEYLPGLFIDCSDSFSVNDFMAIGKNHRALLALSGTSIDTYRDILSDDSANSRLENHLETFLLAYRKHPEAKKRFGLSLHELLSLEQEKFEWAMDRLTKEEAIAKPFEGVFQGMYWEDDGRSFLAWLGQNREELLKKDADKTTDEVFSAYCNSDAKTVQANHRLEYKQNVFFLSGSVLSLAGSFVFQALSVTVYANTPWEPLWLLGFAALLFLGGVGVAHYSSSIHGLKPKLRFFKSFIEPSREQENVEGHPMPAGYQPVSQVDSDASGEECDFSSDIEADEAANQEHAAAQLPRAVTDGVEGTTQAASPN